MAERSNPRRRRRGGAGEEEVRSEEETAAAGAREEPPPEPPEVAGSPDAASDDDDSSNNSASADAVRPPPRSPRQRVSAVLRRDRSVENVSRARYRPPDHRPSLAAQLAAGVRSFFSMSQEEYFLSRACPP